MIQLNIEQQIQIFKKLNIIIEHVERVDVIANKLQAIGMEINTERKIIDKYVDELKEELGLNEPEIFQEDLPF